MKFFNLYTLFSIVLISQYENVSGFLLPNLPASNVKVKIIGTSASTLFAEGTEGSDGSKHSEREGNKLSVFNKNKNHMFDKVSQMAVGSLLFLSTFGGVLGFNPDNADAAQSGRRSGGSSFSRPSTRSYSSSPRTYSGPSRTTINVSPGYGYYGGFGGFGFGLPLFSPFGGYGYYGGGYGLGVSPLDVIILGGLVYGAFTFLRNGVASNQWGDIDEEDFPSSLGRGVSVVKLQIGLQLNDRSVLDSLDRIAANADLSSRSGLASLIHNSALVLLRSSRDWVSGSGESKKFSSSDKGGQSEYNRIAINERAKFEREVTSTSTDAMYVGDKRMGKSDPTFAVVTLCLAIRGSSTQIPKIRGIADLQDALSKIAADSLTDDGENVLATELLWTPQGSDTMTKSDVIQDYPELYDL